MPEQSRANNFLQLPLVEFKRAMKVFTPKRLKLAPALLAFDGTFLSIESAHVTAVMRASGEWHGQATFSAEILRALATVPPAHNPVPIAYADGHLLIAGMTIPCQWWPTSQALIEDLENPNLVDLLALERTLSRVELMGSMRGSRIVGAVREAEQRIQRAAAQLADLEVTESEIRCLVEAKIAGRIKRPE